MLSWERLYLIAHGGVFIISTPLMFALALKKLQALNLLKSSQIYQIVASFLVFTTELFFFFLSQLSFYV